MKLISKQSLEAEIHQLDRLLAQAPASDVLGRMSLTGRLRELKEKLAKIEDEWRQSAEVVIYFGGEPVNGSQSILVDFAAKALEKFQELVSTIYAGMAGSLSDSGKIPGLRESKLALTGMPRGSFGFLLKEQCEREPLRETRLQKAIQEASSMIGGLVPENPGEEIELSAMNSRIFSSLKNFMAYLSENGASLSILTDSGQISIQREEIKASDEYIRNISEVISGEKKLTGIFKGVTGIKRRFDFIPVDMPQFGSNISGKLSRDIGDEFIAKMNIEYMDKKCVAKFEETISKKNDSSRPIVRWTLLDIKPE